MSTFNLLVFAASNSTQSINRRFAMHAASVLQEDLKAPVEIETLDLNHYEMPIYSPEREAAGIPKEAHQFFNKISGADGLIVGFAEYNGSYTAAFKNLFDWASRIEMKIYQDKPMVVLATSPGPRGGQNVLKTAVEAAPFFGGSVSGSLSVGPFKEKFDQDTDRLVSEEDALALREALIAFQSDLKRGREGES